MAGDDVAARGFCSYFTAILRLEDECAWKKARAHSTFIDAVNNGRVRRKSDPQPPRYRFDPGDWNPHNWHGGGLASMDKYGNWTTVSYDGKPGFTKEEYSVADLERLIAEESGGRPDAAPVEGGQVGPTDVHAPGISTKSYVNVDMPLINEMDELIGSGRATSPWAATAQVADKAAGNSTLAKRKRLLKLYGIMKRMNS